MDIEQRKENRDFRALAVEIFGDEHLADLHHLAVGRSYHNLRINRYLTVGFAEEHEHHCRHHHTECNKRPFKSRLLAIMNCQHCSCDANNGGYQRKVYAFRMESHKKIR